MTKDKKSVAEKTAGISMAGFVPRARPGQTTPTETNPAARVVGQEAPKNYTGVGDFMQAVTGKNDIAKKLAEAEATVLQTRAQLAGFEGSLVARLIDPNLIRRSEWANRHEAEFATPEFAELKAEIANAGGNIQPIKVRLLKHADGGVIYGKSPPTDPKPIYEIAFGHRRVQSCIELGLMVLAIVDEDMSDKKLFEEMDRENRARKNLSAWEQGRMYDRALKTGLYSSVRKLAEALGVNLSNAVRSVQLAKLPQPIVDAFATPLDLQVRWSKPLTDALQRDPDSVLAKAKELAKKRGAMNPTQVFDALTGKAILTEPASIEINSGGRRVAYLRVAGKGVVVEFEPNAVPTDRHPELIKLIEQFVAKIAPSQP